MLCLVRPAAEEHEIVRRKDSYRRMKNRPGAGLRTSALDLQVLAFSVGGDRRA